METPLYWFCCAMLGVLPSFAIISQSKKEKIALLLLSTWWHVAVSVLCLCLAVSWAGLHCVIVQFPGHAHLLFV